MIEVYNGAGMANRIKNVVTALFYAHLNHDVVVLNFGHTADNSELDDILTLEQFAVSGNSQVYRVNTWQLSYPFENRNILKDRTKKIVLFNSKYNCYPLENCVDLQYNNILDDIKDLILPYFDRIHFAPYVVQQANQFCVENKIEELTGVHIRSWHDDEDRKNNLHDINLFIDAMRKRTGNFFVATDSAEVLTQLKEVFGDRIISKEIGNAERHVSISKTKQVYVDCITDMLILAKCKSLIGTYMSTFTEVAWWLGGAKQEVEIPLPAFIQEKYKEF
jgi:hypothetical protein